MNISNLKLQPTSSLKTYARNARSHSDTQVTAIANSIEAFGFISPIIIDQHLEVIAGHGRLLAAQKLGLEKIPTLLIDHLSESEVMAYRIADNRLAEQAEWDQELLKVELTYLIEIDYDLDPIGFSPAEVDALIYPLCEETENQEDLPEIPQTPITKPGDLWALGRHRLYCGNALHEKSYTKVMGTDSASLLLSDPPYNVPIDGFVGGKGKIRHREFAMAAGEMSEREFSDFLLGFMKLAKLQLTPQALAYLFMDWRHIETLLTAGKSVFAGLLNLCVWDKGRAGMGSFYRSRHELVAVFRNSKAEYLNNIGLGKNGRNRSNIWPYAGVTGLTKEGQNTLQMHPTVKPTALLRDAIIDCTKPSDSVLDPFGGSGSTLLASEECGRTAHLIEIDPGYVDVTIERFEAATDLKAKKISGE